MQKNNRMMLLMASLLLPRTAPATNQPDRRRANGTQSGVLQEPFPFRLNRNGGSTSLFDAFSSREPVSTPHQVRDRLSLENALGSFTFRPASPCIAISVPPVSLASNGGRRSLNK